MHIQVTYFFTAVVQVVCHFMHRAIAGTHDDDDVFSFGMTVIIEQFVSPSGELRKFLHRFFYNSRCTVIILITTLAALKKNIRVLSSTADKWMLRIQCTV